MYGACHEDDLAKNQKQALNKLFYLEKIIKYVTVGELISNFIYNFITNSNVIKNVNISNFENNLRAEEN